MRTYDSHSRVKTISNPMGCQPKATTMPRWANLSRKSVQPSAATRSQRVLRHGRHSAQTGWLLWDRRQESTTWLRQIELRNCVSISPPWIALGAQPPTIELTLSPGPFSATYCRPMLYAPLFLVDTTVNFVDSAAAAIGQWS